MRVYLDACCLSRLTDDQSQARIREEAEAVERVLVGVRRGTVELLSSEALDDEMRRNPSMDRRVEAQTTLSLAVMTIKVDEAIALRAQRSGRVGIWSLRRTPPRRRRIGRRGRFADYRRPVFEADCPETG